MRRVLHQRVLEAVDRLGRRTSLKDQLGGDELVESRLQLILGEARYSTHQPVGKLASDCCADLRHTPHRTSAVEPCHQRVVQGGRDPDLGRIALQHAFGQFLDKQWNAVGAFGDLCVQLLPGAAQ